MEKGFKIVKIVTITLIVILLTILAFLGLYVKQNNIWVNIIPELNFGMELGGIRELRYVLDTTSEEKNVYIDSEGNILGIVKEDEENGVTLEDTDGVSLEETEETTETTSEEKNQENSNMPNYATEVRTIKANEDSVKTIQNFEKSKKIVQKRLESEDSYEYNIRLDSVTGEMVLELPNDDEKVSQARSAIITKGVFEIIDEQTGIILVDRSDIEKFDVGVYEQSGYQVCLQVTFNPEGSEKLKKMSNEYRQVVNEAGETSTTYVTATLDGETLITTYFGEELTNGVLQIPLGNATTDMDQLDLISVEANRMVEILNGEVMPIAYTLSSDKLVKSTITNDTINIVKVVLLVAFVIFTIILTIKFKANGFIVGVLSIGYVSLLILALKYLATDISVTLNSGIAFLAMIILNYVFNKKMLMEFKNNSNKKEVFWKVTKNYYLTIIPVCIISVIFTLVSSTVISSIGMIFFWGLILQFLYNILTIRALKLI